MATTAPTLQKAPGLRAASPFRSLGYRYGVIGVWVVEIILFSVLVPNTFLSAANFTSLLSSQAPLILLALALVPTLASGEIDLSIAGTMTITATLTAQLNSVYDVNIWVAVIAGLAVALAVGIVNALLAVYLGVQSIVVTLGMGTLLIGLSVWISNSLTISGVSVDLSRLVNTQFLGVNAAFYISIVVGIALWYVYRHTALGRSIVFIGKNAEVARLSGLPVPRLKLVSFVTTSFLAGLAGVMIIGVAGGLQPTSLQTLLLPAFAAAFLGTAIIDPGTANPIGTVVAVLFLATGITGLVLLGMDSWIRDVFYGAAVVVAVAVSRIAYLSSKKKIPA
jgi:ribose transport system permease protein